LGVTDGIKLVRDALTKEWKANARKHFTDIVCCIAYIFRVRGHHYKADLKDRYLSLWGRCLHDEKDLPLPWDILATDVFHAIFPDTLDDFWIESADKTRCAGTLIKRVDSAPAGAAGILALEKGYNDIAMTFPFIEDRIKEPVETMKRIVVDLENSRWGGSINHNLYGVPKLRYNETNVGVLASVVVGVYKTMAQDSLLLQSPALLRLAELAPATGGAIGIMAKRTLALEGSAFLPK
jgi:hypothetical protein